MNLEKKICVCMFCQLLQLGSARTQVVHFFQVRRSSAASDARPRHVRVRVVSGFSALQKGRANIKMAANASVFPF